MRVGQVRFGRKQPLAARQLTRADATYAGGAALVRHTKSI